MGIRDRIEAAKVLVLNNMHNDALILILIAIAASSRKQFSKDVIKNDADAFKAFLKLSLVNVLHRGSGGGDYLEERTLEFTPIGTGHKTENYNTYEVIYKQYRCSFVHEGELPENVIFTGESIPVRKAIQVNLYDKSVATLAVTHDNQLVMDYKWLDVLIKSVQEAEINHDLFGPPPIRENDGQPTIIILGVDTY